MEILSYVLEGGLAHKDSMSAGSTLGPNEIQLMSAGTGVIHSEFNASDIEPTHFLQIWITPSANDIKPSYQQIAYEPSEKRGALRLIASPDRTAAPQSAFINQDARVYAAVLEPGESVTYQIPNGRHAWVQCATGQLDVNGLALSAGDGLAVSDEAAEVMQGAGEGESEFVLFDLA